jgi:hypothetical protein
MNWDDNPLLWEKLDELMINSASEFKEFLDVLFEHKDELNPMMKGLLFGGLGQLVMGYNVGRTESNDPKMSLAIGMEKVMQNPLFNQVMVGNITNIIDRTAENME